MNRQFQILLLFVTMAFAASVRAADSPFNVDIWNTEDSLPQLSIISIVQTRDGYIWLGTENGLVRFDGDAMTPFNVNNTPGLPGNLIVFLFEDSHNILWIGTDSGALCRIEHGVVKNIASGGNGKILGAYEDAGGIWFVTDLLKFYHWQNGQLDLAPKMYEAQTQFLLYFAFRMIVPGKNGDSWQLQQGRVQKWNGEKLQSDLGQNPWREISSWVIAPYPISDRRYGRISFDPAITATCDDNDGNLIVGTREDGVYWFDAVGHFQHLTKTEGLPANSVLSLCVDRDGNLWIGTDGGGLARVRKKNFSAPPEFSGVAKSIAEDAAGDWWVTFNATGLKHAQTNSVQPFGIGAHNNAWSVFVDKDQHVWATAGGEGLFYFFGGNFQPVSAAAKFGSYIYALFQSHDGKLWFGGQNGLGSFDGQDWNLFSGAEGLPPGAVRALAETTNGDLWIGMENAGLFSLRAGKISAVTNAPVKDISCLFADADGTLWVGTFGHGLARFSESHWTTYNSAAGLAGDDVGFLIADDFGNLWIGSYEGLLRVEKKSLSDFADGVTKKISCRTFLTRECFAGAQPAAIRAHDGKLLFPTIDGVIAVNPADLKPDTNPPPVIIESVLVDGVPQKDRLLSSAWPDAITLAPQSEQVEIHFTALNFSAPKGVKLASQFRYKLEGRDKNWTDAGSERVAHYSKLAPGEYRFHVIACNEDGVWNENGATLAIVVEPPFWRTTSFLIGATLISLGVLAGIIYLISTAKLKRELRTLHQKELIERERARIARDLHDQLGANLTQITLLGEMTEMDKTQPDEIEQHAQQICETARDTTRSLDEIVWAVNPSNDTLEGLVNYACKYAQDYFALANISYRAELPPQLPPTPILPEVRHNVFLAFKEAVNNVVKHAQATEARVKLQLDAEKFILSVEDNGRGLGDVSGKKLRNGLKNMRKRLADVHGEFEILPGAKNGTAVRLIVPVKTQA